MFRSLLPLTCLVLAMPLAASDFYVDGNAALGGDVEIGGAVLCPAGTHRAGAWCIGPQQGPATYVNAMSGCWAQGLELCPLQAILACDVMQPAGADCTSFTDSAVRQWTWCAEQPTADDVSAFVGGFARIFAHNGNNTSNEADFAAKSESFAYFCCMTRR